MCVRQQHREQPHACQVRAQQTKPRSEPQYCSVSQRVPPKPTSLFSGGSTTFKVGGGR